MAYNKVMDRVGNILLDLSADTVTEKDVRFGKTFHDSSGNVKQGILDPTVMEIVDSDIPIFDLSKVNFIDTHTGELIASYTIEEAKNLAELPPLPNHPEEDLVGDGWSEDLDTLKTISQGLLVGCYYRTGGDYSMYEILIAESLTLTLEPRIVTVSGTGTSTFRVDWGDGEITENEVISTGKFTLTHTYENPGVYRVKLYYDEVFYDYDNTMVPASYNVIRIYSSTHQYSVSGGSINLLEILYPKYFYDNRTPVMYSYMFNGSRRFMHTYLTPYTTSINCQNSFDIYVGTFIIPSTTKFSGYNGRGYPSLKCYNITINSTGVELNTIEYSYPFLYRRLHTYYIPLALTLSSVYMCAYAKRIIVPEGTETIVSLHNYGKVYYSYIKLPSSLKRVSSISYGTRISYVVDCTLISDPSTLIAGNTNKSCILVVSDENLDAFKTKFDSYFTVMSYDDYVDSGLQEFYEG